MITLGGLSTASQATLGPISLPPHPISVPPTTTPAPTTTPTTTPAPTVLTPPTGVTRTMVQDGVTWWLIPGQNVMKPSGALEWVPEHWVRAGTVTTATVDPDPTKTVINVHPPGEGTGAAGEVANEKAGAFVMTADQSADYPFLSAGYKEAGATPDEVVAILGTASNWGNSQHLDGPLGDRISDLVKMDGDPTVTDTAIYKGVDDTVPGLKYGGQYVALLPLYVLQAKAATWTPAQWYFRHQLERVRAAINKAKADDAAAKEPPATNGTDGTAGGPKPLPLPIAQTSNTTKTIALAILAAGVAYLMLSCNPHSAQGASMPFVEKRNVVFPFIRTIAGAQVNGLMGSAAVLCTDPAFFGGSLLTSAAALGQASDSVTYPAGYSLAQVAQRISLASREGEDLMAITLAPDSAYPDFFLWPTVDGSSQGLHCNIENPLMGFNRANPDVYVTVPHLIPPIDAAAGGQILWDSVIYRDGVVSALRVVPLKLYFWYGMMPVSNPTHRPTLYARTRMQGTAGQAIRFFVPILGRKTVTVRWLQSSVAGSFSIFGIQSSQSGNGAPGSQVEPFFLSLASIFGPQAESQYGEIQLLSPKTDGLSMLWLEHTPPGGGDPAPGLEIFVYGYD